MERDDYGLVIFSAQELYEALYKGQLKTLDNVTIIGDNAWPFNRAKMLNGDKFCELHGPPEHFVSPQDQALEHRSKWFMPDNYCDNLFEKILAKCKTKEQIDRVNLELELYKKYNMLDVLHYLNYLVDVMREHKIVWGVGRGSSVSSYVLYLLGIHKIDSLKYDLDITEFFKGERYG